MKLLWDRLRLEIWLFFCCHVWLWLFYKQRHRRKKDNLTGPSRPYVELHIWCI